MDHSPWGNKEPDTTEWISFSQGEKKLQKERRDWPKAKKKKKKKNPVVAVIGDRRKVQCYKEPYSIGTWNVKSMNKGKLEVVKQKMPRVNINLLGISELQWNGMCEFNWHDQSIYYSGQESLRRIGVAIIINKRVQNAVTGCNLKNYIMISSFPRQTIQYYSNPNLCPNK